MAADPLARARGSLGTVRVRTTVGATAIVGIALLLGAAALVAAMRSTLTSEVRSVARLRAFGVAEAIESTDGKAFPEFNDEDELVEIVDAGGQLAGASPALKNQGRLPALEPGKTVRIRVAIDDDEFIAVAVNATTTRGRYKVIVALSLLEVADAIGVVRRLLLIGLPVLLSLVALTLWKVVGRALAPVEAIRSEVDQISSTELRRRVPEPAGNDEISRLASTMNRMLGRLEDAQARQRCFVSDASHELRSPVASIRQHAEVALAHPEVTSTASLAETVLAENTRLQTLVEDLLLLAKADEKTLKRAYRGIDMDDLVFAEAGRLRSARKTAVSTNDVGAGRVLGDLSQLQRLISNLADNAAKHARSLVRFHLCERGDTVVLYVDDDGNGIPVDQRGRIFERFVRLDAARDREYGGSGLGLAIVAEIVAAHGGQVSAAGSPEGGARIEVTLPRLAD